MMPSGNVTFPIISAVVAPALLILACSSLITTTANRLSLLLDRVRELTREMEILLHEQPKALLSKRTFVAKQLLKGSNRARLLQKTLATLYLALGSLILTSILVGVSAAIGRGAQGVVVTALVSVALLFYASILLIRESQIALVAVNAEMDYVRSLTEQVS